MLPSTFARRGHADSFACRRQPAAHLPQANRALEVAEDVDARARVRRGFRAQGAEHASGAEVVGGPRRLALHLLPGAYPGDLGNGLGRAVPFPKLAQERAEARVLLDERREHRLVPFGQSARRRRRQVRKQLEHELASAPRRPLHHPEIHRNVVEVELQPVPEHAHQRPGEVGTALPDERQRPGAYQLGRPVEIGEDACERPATGASQERGDELLGGQVFGGAVGGHPAREPGRVVEEHVRVALLQIPPPGIHRAHEPHLRDERRLAVVSEEAFEFRRRDRPAHGRDRLLAIGGQQRGPFGGSEVATEAAGLPLHRRGQRHHLAEAVVQVDVVVLVDAVAHEPVDQGFGVDVGVGPVGQEVGTVAVDRLEQHRQETATVRHGR